MPTSALLRGDWDACERDSELGRDDGERIGHAALGDAAAGVDECSEPAPDRSTHGEADERLDDDAASGGKLGEAKVVLSSRRKSSISQRAA